MKKVYLKLKSHKGETLVEIIASILICVISLSLLMSGVAVSVKINENADENDKYFYEALNAAETKQEKLLLTDPVAVIEENSRKIKIPINVYGKEGLYSYEISE